MANKGIEDFGSSNNYSSFSVSYLTKKVLETI